MENVHLEASRDLLVGRTIAAVDFKPSASEQDTYVRLTLDDGGYWEQRMTFTPAEHRLAIAEKALTVVRRCRLCPSCTDVVVEAFAEMEKFV